jgi:hypothetical protein
VCNCCCPDHRPLTQRWDDTVSWILSLSFSESQATQAKEVTFVLTCLVVTVLPSDHPSHATNGPETTNPTCCMRFTALTWSFRWQRLNIHKLLMIGIQEKEIVVMLGPMLIKREICKSKTSQCIWCCSISYNGPILLENSKYYCVLLHFFTITPFHSTFSTLIQV